MRSNIVQHQAQPPGRQILPRRRPRRKTARHQRKITSWRRIQIDPVMRVCGATANKSEPPASRRRLQPPSLTAIQPRRPSQRRLQCPRHSMRLQKSYRTMWETRKGGQCRRSKPRRRRKHPRACNRYRLQRKSLQLCQHHCIPHRPRNGMTTSRIRWTRDPPPKTRAPPSRTPCPAELCIQQDHRPLPQRQLKQRRNRRMSQHMPRPAGMTTNDLCRPKRKKTGQRPHKGQFRSVSGALPPHDPAFGGGLE
jgi:hypothetical protein